MIRKNFLLRLFNLGDQHIAISFNTGMGLLYLKIRPNSSYPHEICSTLQGIKELKCALHNIKAQLPSYYPFRISITKREEE